MGIAGQHGDIPATLVTGSWAPQAGSTPGEVRGGATPGRSTSKQAVSVLGVVRIWIFVAVFASNACVPATQHAAAGTVAYTGSFLAAHSYEFSSSHLDAQPASVAMAMTVS